jgi:uncharacterized protein
MREKNILAKVFIFNNVAYLYDTNKNQILRLSNEMYAEINRYLRSANYTSDAIVSLNKKGYLLENCIAKIEHPFTPFVENLLTRHISALILQVTQNCNFKCRYCSFAHDGDLTRVHTNKAMTFETARRCIDLLATNCVDADNVTISFYGGEPLLNFDLIKRCVEYANTVIYNKPISFSMTTNFYVASDEIIDFLVENEFDILISLDGPQNIQDSHRRLSVNGSGTYQKVLKNVLKIKKEHEKYFNIHVQFNPVVYYDENPMEILEYFEAVLGVPQERVQLQRIDDSGLDISYDPITPETDHLSESLINHKNMIYYENIISDTTPIHEHYHINGSCVPGADKLFVSVDGEFFPCEKVNECNKNMKIGSLDDGFFYDKIKYLMNIGYLNQENCKKCWAIRFCKICCAHCDDGASNLSEKLLINKCKITKKEVLRFLKNYVANNS